MKEEYSRRIRERWEQRQADVVKPRVKVTVYAWHQALCVCVVKYVSYAAELASVESSNFGQLTRIVILVGITQTPHVHAYAY